jgi:hypothetical protein
MQENCHDNAEDCETAAHRGIDPLGHDVFTFKDGSKWSMDLNGNFHPL